MAEKSVGTESSAEGQGGSRSAARLSRLYLDSLRAADLSGAYQVASEALANGMSTPGLYQHVIAPAMHEIGDLWAAGALTVADEHLATNLTNRVLAALRPPLVAEASFGQGGAPPSRR